MTAMFCGDQQIAVLIATKNRDALLVERALSSVHHQTLVPNTLVVVNDGGPHDERVHQELRKLGQTMNVVTVENQRTPGASGAWNTGLTELEQREHRGFVALLDDDDEWDPVHLEVNARAARDERANVVVAGLRLRQHGHDVPRPLLRGVRDRDFLVGNGGWQGSNTFVQLPHLLRVGGFREELRSLNDRDLAIRLLRHPDTRLALVGQWTATWHLGTPCCLSERGSSAKLAGLRSFWALYGNEMTPDEATAFFGRAMQYFDISEEQIAGVAASSGPGRSRHAPSE